jgi:hypothetical protein
MASGNLMTACGATRLLRHAIDAHDDAARAALQPGLPAAIISQMHKFTSNCSAGSGDKIYALRWGKNSPSYLVQDSSLQSRFPQLFCTTAS